MLDYGEYITDTYYPQGNGNGNGYDQLKGDWGLFNKVASKFSHKARFEDREDLLHDIITTLADVARNNGHKPFTEASMYRVASVTVADYWRTQYKFTNGLDCGSCSKAQRRKCRKDWLYTECPKAIRLESLSKPIIDSEGNLTELGELIADDKAIDIVARLDANVWLLGCPKRLIEIASKLDSNIELSKQEQNYLYHFRNRYLKKHQKALF